MCKLKTLILGVVVVLGIVVPAQASLIGDRIDYEGFGVEFRNLSPGSDILVGPGIDFTLTASPQEQYNVDIDESGITIIPVYTGNLVGTNWGSNVATGAHLRSLRISSLDWVGNPFGVITGVTVSGGRNFGPEDVTFSNHAIETSAARGAFELFGDEVLRIDLITSDMTPVPTPSAFLLMGTGLFGLIGYRKYTKNKP